jgi:Domain of unknown function (DUF4411)
MATIRCIDTSSFIALRHYPRDLFDALWSFIEQLVAAGHLIAPHEVLRELSKQDDEIYKWAKSQKVAFIELDGDQGAALKEVLAAFPALAAAMKASPHADPIVVSIALVRSRQDPKNACTVVTEEKLRGDGSHKVPNVCKHFGLKTGTLLDVLREEGLKFELHK